MDSYFTDKRHELLRQAVRDFAESEIRPRIADLEAGGAAGIIEQTLARKIARQGWIGVTVPERYNGMQAGHLAKTIVLEELSRVSGAMGAMAQASQLGVAKLVHFGDEEQKRTWLPRVAAGQCLPTIAVTEPESGGHVLGMSGSAVRDGQDYLLNGRKVYVGNGQIGDLHGVVLRTGEGSHGLSAFLVEADRPGFSLGETIPAMGLHGFGFGELVFDDCRIPAANRLGAEGDGLPVAYSSSVLYGRPNLTAVALGIHRAIVEDTASFCVERQRYGKALSALPSVKLKLGQLQSRLMTARLAAYHAVHLLDRGEACDAELMNAKLVNVESALDSAREAMEIHAACGLYTDRPVERYLRDAHHIFAPAGTSDIQRHRLAEVALGSYQRQWSDRLSDVVRLAEPTVPTQAGPADPVGVASPV